MAIIATSGVHASINVVARVRDSPAFKLVLEPELSVVLFTRLGWDDDDYERWSNTNAEAGTALIVPTKWQDEVCFRICIVNPLTELPRLEALLDDMAG